MRQLIYLLQWRISREMTGRMRSRTTCLRNWWKSLARRTNPKKMETKQTTTKFMAMAEICRSYLIAIESLQTIWARHDKTNKMASAQSDESSLSAWRKLGSLATHWAYSEDSWSDWADAQTDLSLRWAHTHFVGFVMLWLIYIDTRQGLQLSCWKEYLYIETLRF